MPLARKEPRKEPREPHRCTPVKGEFGRYVVASRSAAKDGKDEAYIVDVLQKEEHADFSTTIGTCPCKGYQVRKRCSHLDDAKAEHARLNGDDPGPPGLAGDFFSEHPE